MARGNGEQDIYHGHPSWRSMLEFHLGAVVVAVLAGAIGYFAAGIGIAVAAFFAFFLVSLAAGYLRRVATLYRITDRRLHIRRGLLSRAEQHTTIDRIQNVNTRQSLLQRLLRVGSVDFDTAGTDDSEFTFEGIANPRAVVAAVDEAQRRAGITPV